MSYVSSGPVLARSDTSWLTEWRRTVDWGLIGGATFLILIGLLMSLAAGPTASMRIGYDDPYFFTFRHLVFASAGIGLMLVVSTLDKTWARRLSIFVFVGAIMLMMFILVAGHEVKGAQRWLRVAGFSLQPSEVVKPGLIVMSSWLLSQRGKYDDGHWAWIAFVFYAVTIGLLLLQPDVGQAFLLTAGFMAVFFVSGLPLKWFLGFSVGGLGLGGLLYALFPHVRERIHMFIDPASADTYQIDKAAEAISRGGLFGVGPGEGLVKSRLPDAHTDFIFSVMAEEFGLVAVITLFAIFVLMILRGFRAAARVHDDVSRAAAAGLFTLFGLQAVINLAVNLALIPPKGMTLPFVSYGGSSMIGTGLTLGLALALVRGQGTRAKGRYG